MRVCCDVCQLTNVSFGEDFHEMLLHNTLHFNRPAPFDAADSPVPPRPSLRPGSKSMLPVSFVTEAVRSCAESEIQVLPAAPVVVVAPSPTSSRALNRPGAMSTPDLDIAEISSLETPSPAARQDFKPPLFRRESSSLVGLTGLELELAQLRQYVAILEPVLGKSHLEVVMKRYAIAKLMLRLNQVLLHLLM